MLQLDTTKKILNIQTYKNMDELRNNHPQVKSWSYIYHIPRGMTSETMRQAVKQVMTKQGQWYSMVYHVGDFILAPAINTPKICTCLEFIGDNGPCSIHGDPYGHLEGRT